MSAAALVTVEEKNKVLMLLLEEEDPFLWQPIVDLVERFVTVKREPGCVKTQEPCLRGNSFGWQVQIDYKCFVLCVNQY